MKKALAAAVVALALAGVGVAVLMLGRNPLRFPYLSGVVSDPALLAARPGWAVRTLEVEPGVSVRGLVRRPADPEAKWVLFFSGNDAAMLLTAQTFLEKVRGERDWGMAVFAYRGFDGSSGKASAPTLFADGVAALTWLAKEDHVKAEKLNVVAFSMGTPIAIHVVADAAQRKQPVSSLTLLASTPSLEMFHPSWAGRFTPGQNVDSSPWIAGMPGPVLLVHGTEDATLPIAGGRTIKEALGDRARMLDVRGAGHTDLLENAVAIEATRAEVESPGK